MRRLTGGVVWAATLALICAGVASAHAYLKASDPVEDTTVTTVPREVRLVFTEPVEVRFSIFKVYRLNVDAAMEIRRLNAAAGALVSDVLRKRGDEAERADAGPDGSERTTNDVTIRLKPDPKPGVYVVMWRVLSIDTHTTQGFFVFILAPRPSGG